MNDDSPQNQDDQFLEITNEMLVGLAHATNDAVKEMRQKAEDLGFGDLDCDVVAAMCATAVFRLRKDEIVCPCSVCSERINLIANEISKRLFLSYGTHDDVEPNSASNGSVH